MFREKPSGLVSGPVRSTSSPADRLQTKEQGRNEGEEKSVAGRMREKMSRVILSSPLKDTMQISEVPALLKAEQAFFFSFFFFNKTQTVPVPQTT